MALCIVDKRELRRVFFRRIKAIAYFFYLIAEKKNIYIFIRVGVVGFMMCCSPKTLFLTKNYEYVFKNVDYFSIDSIDFDVYIDYFPAPCRKCFNCKQNRINFWKLKLKSELFSSKEGIFLTLTFDDEHLDDFSKDTYQKYLKRLRKSGLKFKYFIIAELGDETLRPHFHCILFGLTVDNEELLREKWSCGFIQVKPLFEAHFGYLVNYLFKNTLFMSYSKELGYDFYKSEIDNGYFNLNGLKNNFSSYFAKKYLTEDQQLLREDRIKQFYIEQEQVFKSKYGLNWKNVYFRHLRQKNLDLMKKFEQKNMI